jgi:hypothetical protein
VFCELVHLAFGMLFCIRSCQGAEEHIGTWALHPWSACALEDSVLEAVVPYIGQAFSVRIILCAPSLSLSSDVFCCEPQWQNRDHGSTFCQHQKTEHLKDQA